MPGETTVSMSLVVFSPDSSSVEITQAESAELYPETLAGAGYDKCLAPRGLDDPDAARIGGLWDLCAWVKANDANIVIIHDANAAALGLGATGRIGLTSDSFFFKTITKKLRVLTDDPLNPLTVDDLRRMGYVL